MSKHEGRLQLLAMIDEAFDHKAWHGPTLWGALRGVSAATAAQRPARGRHSIHELVVHCAYWKYVVRRRLTGALRGSFVEVGSNWFERRGVDEAAWRRDLGQLRVEHRALREVIAAVDPARLSRPIDGNRRSAAFTIRGSAAHDLYHAGQIQLIKAMKRK